MCLHVLRSAIRTQPHPCIRKPSLPVFLPHDPRGLSYISFKAYNPPSPSLFLSLCPYLDSTIHLLPLARSLSPSPPFSLSPFLPFTPPRSLALFLYVNITYRVHPTLISRRFAVQFKLSTQRGRALEKIKISSSYRGKIK
jgi:hypothetical protein